MIWRESSYRGRRRKEFSVDLHHVDWHFHLGAWNFRVGSDPTICVGRLNLTIHILYYGTHLSRKMLFLFLWKDLN